MEPLPFYPRVRAYRFYQPDPLQQPPEPEESVCAKNLACVSQLILERSEMHQTRFTETDYSMPDDVAPGEEKFSSPLPTLPLQPRK